MTYTNIKQNPADRVDQYLDTVGDGTGTTNANGDYIGEVEEFKIVAPPNRGLFLERMMVFIRDTGALTAEKYGVLAELTNGVSVKVKAASGAVLHDLTAGLPVKSNANWKRLCYDVEFNTFPSGDEFVTARWTFSKAGAPVYLGPGQYLSVDVNDTLTGLVEHYFLVQGRKS